MTPGNLVHRRASIPVFGSIIGHAGIVVAADRVIDCSVGRGRRAVQEISLQQFINGEEFWGERELPGVTPQQKSRIVARAREILLWPTEYDDAHNNQKGKWFNEGTSNRYWETDCVGLCEHCYEHVGLDIVRKEGTPLTVTSQRDSMRLVSRMTPEGRSQLFASYLNGNLSQYEQSIFHQEFPSDLLEKVFSKVTDSRDSNLSISHIFTNGAKELNLISEDELKEVLQRLGN
jgi:hypothetical protein